MSDVESDGKLTLISCFIRLLSSSASANCLLNSFCVSDSSPSGTSLASVSAMEALVAADDIGNCISGMPEDSAGRVRILGDTGGGVTLRDVDVVEEDLTVSFLVTSSSFLDPLLLDMLGFGGGGGAAFLVEPDVALLELVVVVVVVFLDDMVGYAMTEQSHQAHRLQHRLSGYILQYIIKGTCRSLLPIHKCMWTTIRWSWV